MRPYLLFLIALNANGVLATQPATQAIKSSPYPVVSVASSAPQQPKALQQPNIIQQTRVPAPSSRLDNTEIRFATPEQAERANQLAASLRCPSCQNQNLLESNSVLARDLRLEVFRRVAAGDNDEEIRRSLIARYGDFVTYRPPLKLGTLLLWGTPPFLLLIAGMRLFYRRKYHAPSHSAPSHNRIPPSPQQQPADPPAESSKTASLSIGLALLVVASTVIGVGAGYQRLGHWEAWRNWQANPDPLQNLDGAALRSAAGARLHQRINQDPRDQDAWAELAQWLLYQNRFDESLWAYEQLTQLEGETRAATLAARATVMYYRDGQQMSAPVKRELAQALAQDPGEVTALMLLASDHFLNGRYQDAATIWQRLLDDSRPRLNRESVIMALQTAQTLNGI